jgi:hypothetical protein
MHMWVLGHGPLDALSRRCTKIRMPKPTAHGTNIGICGVGLRWNCAMTSEEITYDGRQLTDARVLAKLTIGGLAKTAKVTWMTISRLETAGTIRVAPQGEALIDSIVRLHTIKSPGEKMFDQNWQSKAFLYE